MDKSKESARGSGPIPDHKVFGGSLLFGASVRTLRRRFVQPGCTNHTDYFCGRPSSVAFRRIYASMALTWNGKLRPTQGRIGDARTEIAARIEKLRLYDATTLSASSPADPHA